MWILRMEPSSPEEQTVLSATKSSFQLPARGCIFITFISPFDHASDVSVDVDGTPQI